MNEQQLILEHLQEAERILLALNGDAAVSSNLHSAKVNIWKAIENMQAAIIGDQP